MPDLEAGVREGIITSAQLDALIARATAPRSSEPEARHGFNAVYIAYWAGAIAVLFALGWFLIERWQQLGAAGVFVVGAVYGIAFAIASRRLATRGYRNAASITATLVVATVPVVSWSVMKALGMWHESTTLYATKLIPDGAASTRWVPIDIATLAAAVLALRLVRFPLLMAAVSVAFWYLVLHLGPLVFGAQSAIEHEGWIVLFVGACLLSFGSLVNSLQLRGEIDMSEGDYAFWPFVLGLGAMLLATMELWSKHHDVVPHVMLAASALSVAVSLRLRRREFLVAGAVGFVGYLAWLAFDVFRKTLGFPIVLAGFGLAIILLAVWVQRRYPEVLRRTTPGVVGKSPNS